MTAIARARLGEGHYLELVDLDQSKPGQVQVSCVDGVLVLAMGWHGEDDCGFAVVGSRAMRSLAQSIARAAKEAERIEAEHTPHFCTFRDWEGSEGYLTQRCTTCGAERTPRGCG